MKTFKQFLESEEDKIYAKKLGEVSEFTPAIADGNYRVGDVTFSAKDGLGSVPYNQDVYYFGFVVEMRPSVFLKLALDHAGQRGESAAKILKLMDEGYAVGQPWLQITLKEFEESGDAPRVVGHEGRARMLAIQQKLGDKPIPVHIMLAGGDRAHRLTPESIAAIKARIQAERSPRIIKAPFDRMYVNRELV